MEYTLLHLIHFMMTSSNGNIFRLTGHLCGEFTGPRWIPRTRPVTRGFDIFFDLHPDKRLSKQSWGWWFETPSHSLWRHRNALDNSLKHNELTKVLVDVMINKCCSVRFDKGVHEFNSLLYY